MEVLGDSSHRTFSHRATQTRVRECLSQCLKATLRTLVLAAAFRLRVERERVLVRSVSFSVPNRPLPRAHFLFTPTDLATHLGPVSAPSVDPITATCRWNAATRATWPDFRQSNTPHIHLQYPLPDLKRSRSTTNRLVSPCLIRLTSAQAAPLTC